MTPTPVDPAQALAGSPITSALDPGSRENLARASIVRTYRRGQVLVNDGEPSQWLYIVCSGRVRVVRYSDDGTELVFAVIEPGGVIGELSVFDGEPRSATVEAIESCDVLCIPNARIREALLASPSSLMAILTELTRMIRRLTGSASDLVFLDVPHRIARYLLQQAVDHGDGAGHVDLVMSQSGVAAQLGVARQTFNTALGSLARDGLLVVDGKRIDIPDLAALADFLDG